MHIGDKYHKGDVSCCSPEATMEAKSSKKPEEVTAKYVEWGGAREWSVCMSNISIILELGEGETSTDPLKDLSAGFLPGTTLA